MRSLQPAHTDGAADRNQFQRPAATRSRYSPRPPEPPPAKASERRLGVAPGGGYFGFKGVYVLTPDGMLHEQVMTTGADFAPPVKFLPAADASSFGLNFDDKMIYTATGRGCGGVPNGLWAIDLASADYPVASYATQKARPLALTGPVITPDGNCHRRYRCRNLRSKFRRLCRQRSLGRERHEGCGLVHARRRNGQLRERFSSDLHVQGKAIGGGPRKRWQLSPFWTPRRWAARITTPRCSKRHLSPRLAKSTAGTASRPGQDKDGTVWVFASVSSGHYVERLNSSTGRCDRRIQNRRNQRQVRSQPGMGLGGHGESSATTDRQWNGDCFGRRQTPQLTPRCMC